MIILHLLPSTITFDWNIPDHGTSHLEESLNHQAMTHQNAGLPWSCLIVLSTKQILHKYMVKPQTNINLRWLDTVKPQSPLSSSKLVFATKSAWTIYYDSWSGWKKTHLLVERKKHVTWSRSQEPAQVSNFIYKEVYQQYAWNVKHDCIKFLQFSHVFLVVFSSIISLQLCFGPFLCVQRNGQDAKQQPRDWPNGSQQTLQPCGIFQPQGFSTKEVGMSP